MPVNTKYPNMPPEFPRLVREARKAQGLSLKALSERTGLYVSLINQFERGLRNISFDRAVLLHDALAIDITLPEPNLSQRKPIIRKGTGPKIERKPFHIILNGELIQVLTYRNLGSTEGVQQALLVDLK
jgi:transcriptional regulator with XRE-family HTH domain